LVNALCIRYCKLMLYEQILFHMFREEMTATDGFQDLNHTNFEGCSYLPITQTCEFWGNRIKLRLMLSQRAMQEKELAHTKLIVITLWSAQSTLVPQRLHLCWSVAYRVMLSISKTVVLVTKVKTPMLLTWFAMSCEPVGTYQLFGATYFLHLQASKWGQYVLPKRPYLPTGPHDV
jgi:hypothetical protein